MGCFSLCHSERSEESLLPHSSQTKGSGRDSSLASEKPGDAALGMNNRSIYGSTMSLSAAALAPAPGQVDSFKAVQIVFSVFSCW